MKRTLTFLLLMSSWVIVAGVVNPINYRKVRYCRFGKHKKKKFCYVSFVRVDGKVFLVKQKRFIQLLVSAVYDVFAAHIASSLDPSIAHKVSLLPAFEKFPGKKYDDWPATLHTIAPGARLKDKNSPYKNMNIKQGPGGLRREMISWMSQHDQLIKIIALDIFLCNHDRHKGNLFYNSKTKTFCAIDMDMLFEHNLAASSCFSLMRMQEESLLFPLSMKEFFALLQLRYVLKSMVKKHSIGSLTELFNKLIDQAGLRAGSPIYISRIESEIDATRRMIRQSHHDTFRLINILEDILHEAVSRMPMLRNFKAVIDFENEKNML